MIFSELSIFDTVDAVVGNEVDLVVFVDADGLLINISFFSSFCSPTVLLFLLFSRIVFSFIFSFFRSVLVSFSSSLLISFLSGVFEIELMTFLFSSTISSFGVSLFEFSDFDNFAIFLLYIFFNDLIN